MSNFEIYNRLRPRRQLDSHSRFERDLVQVRILPGALWKVGEYGWSQRFAKPPCPLKKAIRVRIPYFPLVIERDAGR